MRVIDEIKNYIHVNPDWVDNHIIPKDNIEEAGTQYAKEAIAKGTIADDIETLLSELDRLRNPKSDAEKDFYEIAFVGYNVIKAKRLANIYAIFIKGIISELNGKAICSAAQIEEWRERYAVRLEGLKGKIQQVKKTDIRLKPISDNRTKEIFTKLIDYKYIDCEESAFLWYFGEERHRRKEQPRKIKWVGTDIKIFSLFWKLINKFGSDNNVKWKIARDYFIIPEDWENEYISLSEKSKKEFFKEKARQAEETQYENREEIDRVIDIFSSIINEEEIKKEIERWDAIIQMIKKNREYKYSPDKNERQLYNPKFDIE